MISLFVSTFLLLSVHPSQFHLLLVWSSRSSSRFLKKKIQSKLLQCCPKSSTSAFQSRFHILSKDRFLADRTIGRAIGTVCRLFVVCRLSVCDVLYSGETAGQICMKFSGKVWSDHGTTWLHFGSIRVNRAMPITRKLLDRFA